MELRALISWCKDREIILNYPHTSSAIRKVLKEKSQSQREMWAQKKDTERCDVTGFEDGRNGPLETWKGQEMESHIKLPSKNIALQTPSF